MSTSPNVKRSAPLHAQQLQQSWERLEDIKRPNLTTREFAFYSNKSLATCYWWASTGKGPVQPVRGPNGRLLGWRVLDVKRYLGVQA